MKGSCVRPAEHTVTDGGAVRIMSGMRAARTLTEIKAAEATRRQEAVEALKPILRAYARAHHGRFYIYGSAARHAMRAHSDVDVLVDFAEDAEAEAWNFAEDICVAHGLTPDIMRRSWSKASFLDHIMQDAEEIA